MKVKVLEMKILKIRDWFLLKQINIMKMGKLKNNFDKYLNKYSNLFLKYKLEFYIFFK